MTTRIPPLEFDAGPDPFCTDVYGVGKTGRFAKRDASLVAKRVFDLCGDFSPRVECLRDRLCFEGSDPPDDVKTGERTFARRGEAGEHVVDFGIGASAPPGYERALLPESTLPLLWLVGSRQYPGERPPERTSLATISLCGVQTLFSGNAWHAVLWEKPCAGDDFTSDRGAAQS